MKGSHIVHYVFPLSIKTPDVGYEHKLNILVGIFKSVRLSR